MGLSRIFDISRRSLQTYQNSMNIASHNIANAANKDFTRQRANLAAENPEKNANFVWGTGIKLDSITRVRDGLVDKQLIANQQNFSFSDKQSLILSQLEQVFSEPSELGVSNLMNNFFNSWNELAVNPKSVPLRNNVIYSAQNMATKVESINKDIDTIKYDMFLEFKQQTEVLNSHLQLITQLNKQIFQSTAGGLAANDLMDQRDKAIGELSKLVNITVSYDKNGSANVSIGGIFAADGAAATEFEVVNDDGKLTLAAINTVNSVQLRSGELGAISDIYSKKIPDYQNQIDSLFTQLVSSVNAIHQGGYTTESSPRTGIDFFKEYKDGKLVLSDDILNSPENIAVSADGTDGNSDIAIELAELSEASSISGASFGSYYNSFISQIGNDNLSANRSLEANQMVITQLEMQKQSVSGVSVDEEMTEIIKYQRAYDASAKLIRIADEMLETLMTLV